MMRALALVALVGCGRIDFGPHGATSHDAPAQPPSDAIAVMAPTNGLVAYWPMDDFAFATGTGSTDDTAGANTATCTTNCPSPTAGVIGNALAFDGTTSCLTVPTLKTWAAATFTISAWVKSSTMTGPVVVHESESGCPSPELAVNAGVGIVQLNTTGSTPHNEAWTPTAIATPSSWHHVAISWDGASQAVYVDGECSCSKPQALGPMLGQVQPFTIGCYPTGGPTFLAGAIDEVRIYDRVLAPDEIGALYEVGGGAAQPWTACAAACAGVAP